MTSQVGKEAVLAILGPGDFFGEGCLNGETLQRSTVTALTDCAVVQVEKSAMIDALSQEPKFASLFINHILARKERVEQSLLDAILRQQRGTPGKNPAATGEFPQAGRPEPVIEKISQDTLAKMVGTTRSRISYFMNKFRRQGHIEYNGEIRIHPSLANIVLHEQPYDPGPDD